MMDQFLRDFDDGEYETKYIDQICDLEMKDCTQSKFRIIHNNIRSVEKNLDEFKINLRTCIDKFHVVVLTETFQISDLRVYHIDGYTSVYNGGTYNKNDGVIIYIREDLEYRHRIVPIGDITALEVDIQLLGKIIRITGIYRSPQICTQRFNQDLFCNLENADECDQHVLVGDMNVDLMASNDVVVEEYKNILSYFGYRSYINDITRPHSGSCLDHIYLKSNNTTIGKNHHAYIARTDITDHYSIIICLDYEKNQKTTTTTYKSYVNYAKMKDYLRNINWQEIIKGKNVNAFADTLINVITTCLIDNTKKKKLTYNKAGKKDWITPSILKSIIKKNTLYKEHIKDPYNSDLKKKYNAYKNVLQKLIKTAKNNYMNNCVLRNSSRTRSLWSFVDKVCGNVRPETKISSIRSTSGRVVTSGKEIVEEFGEYFGNIGKQLADNIKENQESVEDVKFCGSSLFLFPTCPSEVELIIMELKNNGAPGKDGIKSELLKKIKGEISEPLSLLVNLCFETGQFPRTLKTGIVVPLYKSGEKTNIENYRPITLTSNFAKIIEKIFKNRILCFLDKNKILSDNQYGFRKGCSTEDAIRKLTKNIYNWLDTGRMGLCVFIDLAKAFDTVCHKKLLGKLYRIGFRGRAYDLIEDYITERTQQIGVNDHVGEIKSTEYGVPQGTVLGPILFIIYMNNLLLMEGDGDIISFADDTVILYEDASWSRLKLKAEKDLYGKIQWFKENKLTLNLMKTKYLPFSSYKTGLPHMGNLEVDRGVSILEAEKIKYLGIMVDRHLRWDLHIDLLVRKLRCLLPKFRHLRGYMSTSYLRMIYLSLCQSLIKYGIIGWGGAYICHMRRVEIIQKWILRTIYEKPLMFPSGELYDVSGVLTPHQLFALEMIYSVNAKKIDIKMSTSDHETRNRRNQVFRPRAKKRIGERCFTYLAPRVYTNVPDDLKNGRRLIKKKLRHWIMERGREYFYRIVNP